MMLILPAIYLYFQGDLKGAGGKCGAITPFSWLLSAPFVSISPTSACLVSRIFLRIVFCLIRQHSTAFSGVLKGFSLRGGVVGYIYHFCFCFPPFQYHALSISGVCLLLLLDRVLFWAALSGGGRVSDVGYVGKRKNV